MKFIIKETTKIKYNEPDPNGKTRRQYTQYYCGEGSTILGHTIQTWGRSKKDSHMFNTKKQAQNYLKKHRRYYVDCWTGWHKVSYGEMHNSKVEIIEVKQGEK